jgi:hypothetical protein
VNADLGHMPRDDRYLLKCRGLFLKFIYSNPRPVILNLFQDLMVGLEISSMQVQKQKPHKDSDPPAGGRNDPKSLNNLQRLRFLYRLGSAFYVQFFVEMREMGFGCVHRDKEFVGDLLIR